MSSAWNEAHFKCHECGRHLSVQNTTVEEVTLTYPWRFFVIKGWAGRFIACSNGCEAGIRARHPEA